MKDLIFVIPCFNASSNLIPLFKSLQAQKNKLWKAIIIDDVSTDLTFKNALELSKADERITVIKNESKKFALRNIVEVARQNDAIIAIIDGDDELCSENTVDLVMNAHENAGVVAWTAHKWDVNGLNVSREMPQKVNPYQFQWCSSHLKTFDSALLKQISDANFKDHLGNWFERGYDQALMLPLLYKATDRVYIKDVCYLYKINSCSIINRDWAEMKQIRTINMVRSRGLIDG